MRFHLNLLEICLNPVLNNLVLKNPVVIRGLVVSLLFCDVPSLHATTLTDTQDVPAALVSEHLPPVSFLNDRSTIDELLRLDTQAAINTARRKVSGPKEAEHSLMSLASHPIVQAIYGTGRTLTAEVLIDGHIYTFKSARRKSLTGAASGYALDRIAPPCIYLSKAKNQEVSCLEVARR